MTKVTRSFEEWCVGRTDAEVAGRLEARRKDWRNATKDMSPIPDFDEWCRENEKRNREMEAARPLPEPLFPTSGDA